MKSLRACLDKTGESQAEFARRIGVSKSYMSELLSGGKTPSLSLALKIADATRGSVPVEAWASATRPAAIPHQS